MNLNKPILLVGHKDKFEEIDVYRICYLIRFRDIYTRDFNCKITRWLLFKKSLELTKYMYIHFV